MPIKMLALSLVLCLIGCTPAQLAKVSDASNKRDTICAFVEAWSTDRPELQEAQKLCEAGADLKEVAAAYAGCTVPVEEE
jgi:hypothetical protein